MEPVEYVGVCPLCKVKLKMKIIIKPKVDIFKIHEYDWLIVDDYNSVWGGEGP